MNINEHGDSLLVKIKSTKIYGPFKTQNVLDSRSYCVLSLQPLTRPKMLLHHSLEEAQTGAN